MENSGWSRKSPTFSALYFVAVLLGRKGKNWNCVHFLILFSDSVAFSGKVDSRLYWQIMEFWPTLGYPFKWLLRENGTVVDLKRINTAVWNLAFSQTALSELIIIELGCWVKANCSLVGHGLMGKESFVGVFLRNPSPYLREFQYYHWEKRPTVKQLNLCCLLLCYHSARLMMFYLWISFMQKHCCKLFLGSFFAKR